jgi:hypothetical protein
MTNSYRKSFYKSLQRQPLRQSIRVLDYQMRVLATARRNRAARARLAAENGTSIHPVPEWLQPPSHYYQGYKGPWIEDYFFEFWLREKRETELIYLPIFWTDYFLHAQVHKYTPRQFERIQSLLRHILDEELDTTKRYFTLLEYDHPIWDWHLFPDNVLVFSAGGGGDVPAPLLKGSPPLEQREKDIRVSFVGRLDGASDQGGVRSRMYESLKDIALFTSGAEWKNLMARSVFSLCPRGLGRTSFRLYEALSVCSIPIYIWDGVEWLPYREELPWDEFCISLPVDEVDRIPERIAAWSEKKIDHAVELIAHYYKDYFTLEGMCVQIMRMAQCLADDLNRITARRIEV